MKQNTNTFISHIHFVNFKMGNYESKKEMQDTQKLTTEKESRLKKALDEMRSKQTRPKCILNVERSNILRIGMSHFKSPGSDLNPIGVVMETDGLQETTCDLGGPLREFFTVFFKEVLRKDVDMFEGQDQGRNLIPVNNEKATEAGWFQLLGRAIVVSLISGGPGFPYLAPYVVNYIRKREYMHELSVGMIHNTILRQYIKRLNDAKSQDELDETICSDSMGYTDQCGWPRTQMITMASRLHLTQTLIKWELVGKRAEALKQLQAGLDTLSFLDKTADMSEADDFLIHRNTEKATADYLKKSLREVLDDLKASTDQETNAKQFTLRCTEMLTDAEATSLFHFITGLSSLPVADIPIEVEFNTVNKNATLPEAITCIQRLRIPLGNESQMEFYSSFHKALSVGKYGFHGNEHV